ncbi:glycoside hydrolase domain-containing protein [Chryseobacterium sp. T16E-39]|uniref:glycoside hydrolase domain-containing protein n=1 Tax=Chryseobacterium sp. T16E-39 TaxID=2015076 RepID=UPI001E3C6284|nr:glycoside hydrolase domain-containing protein [Chryseobacterium sp. T16E-39]
MYPPRTQKWNADELGNQRAVLRWEASTKQAKATIPWRNVKVSSDQKLIIIDSLTQKQYEPDTYLNVNEEEGSFIFTPISGKGIYYVYFLPYQLDKRTNYPTASYLKKNDKGTGKEVEMPLANLLKIESVDSFDSNEPMEMIATQKEVDQYKAKHQNEAYLIFPEVRENPIKMNRIPQHWVDGRKNSSVLQGKTERGMFYAFQIGVLPLKTDLKKVKIIASSLKNVLGATIESQYFNCINTDGIGYNGDQLQLNVDVKKDDLQAFWCGFDIPETTSPGTYKGTIMVQPENAAAQMVKIILTVGEGKAVNKGFDEPWKMTRLPWLNSTLAQGNTVIKPYTPLQVKGQEISLLGRKVILDGSGFPKQIETFFTPEMTSIGKRANPLLNKPIHFVTKSSGTNIDNWKSSGIQFAGQEEGKVSWSSTSTSENLKMQVEGSIEFDGFMEYTVKITALNDIALQDIAMQIPFAKDKATYMMGLGQKGGYRPENFEWKWDVAKKNQDGAWLGNVNAGIQFSLRDQNYSRPLNTNFYLQKPLILPASWGNDNKGGVSVKEMEGGVLVNSFSGARNMKKGEELYYNFHLLITPFHPINTEEQWNNRFYHAYKPVDTIKASGANVINIHHGNEINPYINYPFVATKEMKEYIAKAHEKGLKVKIYNTIREVSNRMYELYPVKSLGQEVFSSGKGGGYSWLQEHLHDNYIAAWYVPEFKDAAIINSGMNRWHNYYVEGMNWLVNNLGIDGIYLDDVAFDRVTMKRIKRVMTQNGHPGIIDLHSANQYNDKDGFNNSANLYLEHFPYINRLWFGEYFDYNNNSPEFLLTEVSGIPFGLMGEMLQDDGNPWRGMLYGMTSRLGWSGKSNPTHLWKAWDDFGIKGSKMIGYWVNDNPVKTDNPAVLATIYQQGKKVMISLASWAPDDTQVRLKVDWKKLGLNPKNLKMSRPAIKDFQEAKIFNMDEEISIPKNKGCLLIIQ